MQRGLSAYRSALLAGLFLFGVLSLSLAHSAFAAGAAGETSSQKTVYVNGTGVVWADPDTAVINFNVSLLSAGSASEAQKANAATTDELINLIKGLGVDSKDIKSSYFSIWPDYDYSVVPEGESLNKANAYRVENQIQVEVHDLTMIGRIIEEATTIENVLMQGVNYLVEDQKEYIQEAREKAAADATDRAAALGKLFHFNVGEIISVSESSYYGDPYYGGYGGGGGMGTIPQQVRVQADVSVTFELLNP